MASRVHSFGEQSRRGVLEYLLVLAGSAQVLRLPEGLVDGIGPLDPVQLEGQVPPRPRRQDHEFVPCTVYPAEA